MFLIMRGIIVKVLIVVNHLDYRDWLRPLLMMRKEEEDDVDAGLLFNSVECNTLLGVILLHLF